MQRKKDSLKYTSIWKLKTEIPKSNSKQLVTTFQKADAMQDSRFPPLALKHYCALTKNTNRLEFPIAFSDNDEPPLPSAASTSPATTPPSAGLATPRARRQLPRRPQRLPPRLPLVQRRRLWPQLLQPRRPAPPLIPTLCLILCLLYRYNQHAVPVQPARTILAALGLALCTGTEPVYRYKG
uniref:Uncharacterized protein n=1 Tax=Ananas comosus var. bracteatus TaxID=296719 RepID=A0A6V7PP02_ANACO|nr:unnamed protein product [Ananas comosus var. bracteatus]